MRFAFLLVALGLTFGAPSSLLGIDLPGQAPSELQKIRLHDALQRVASLVQFSCHPIAWEVFPLDRPLEAQTRKDLERSLEEVGWNLRKASIGSTQIWFLEREILGRKVRALMVEAREGGQAFLGVCARL